MVHGGQMAPYMICTVHAKLKATNDTNIENIVKKLNETIFTQMSAQKRRIVIYRANSYIKITDVSNHQRTDSQGVLVNKITGH